MPANEEIDDLEYHVTFPVPTPGADRDDGLNSVEDMLRRNETAVMVIGWMGCEDKYLAKYSKIYEDVGCTTVRYSTTHGDVFGTKLRQKQVANKLLDVLVDMNLSDNPVLFHIFSNGGCKIYNAMRDALKDNSKFEDIEKLGVVYDSAPGMGSVSQQVSAVFPDPNLSVWASILKIGFYAFTSLVFGLDTLFQTFGWQLRSSTYMDMMYYQDGCPELYLFSKADELVSASDVENMIERRRMQGVDISFECWDDSPHVQHMRVHRESYLTHCYHFIKKCLQIENADATEQ